MDVTKALFTIRIAAETTGLHPQTIRLYEQRGLITPARSDGGTRMYSVSDIELLEEIHELSDAGVGIEGISRILEMEQYIEQLEKQVEALMRGDKDAATTSIIMRKKKK